MKRFFTLVLAAVCLTVCLASCGSTETNTEEPGCAHDFSDATCLVPKTCKNCEQTEGDVLPHTIKGKTCPTCGASVFDVLVLFDAEPGKNQDSPAEYDYYLEESKTMAFYGKGQPLESGTNIAGCVKITAMGIETLTYDWEIIIQEYYKQGNSYDKYLVKGTFRAGEFNSESTLQIDSWEKVYGFTDLTEEQVSAYVSTYGTGILNSAINDTIIPFLRENGTEVSVLGLDNYVR